MNSFFYNIKDQDFVIKQLKKSLFNDVKQNYMFIGEKGVGKKLTALTFSKILLCGNNNNKLKRFEKGIFSDFLAFYDDGKSLKIETTKKLIIESNHKALEGKYKVIFIENGERMTEESENSLLKTIEEPPQGIIFIITVSEPEKISPTLFSRMERYYFNLLSESTISKILKKEKNKEISFKLIGSIDEAKILLNCFKNNFFLFDEFIDLFLKNKLYKIFEYAEFLSKSLNVKILLNYYEKEAEKKIINNIKNNKNLIFYEIVILSIEEIIRKINNNINLKHALEYGFLNILYKTKENCND